MYRNTKLVIRDEIPTFPKLIVTEISKPNQSLQIHLIMLHFSHSDHQLKRWNDNTHFSPVLYVGASHQLIISTLRKQCFRVIKWRKKSSLNLIVSFFSHVHSFKISYQPWIFALAKEVTYRVNHRKLLVFFRFLTVAKFHKKYIHNCELKRHIQVAIGCLSIRSLESLLTSSFTILKRSR